MRRVVIESPYAGDVERNTAYARACLKHSLSLGEAPLASHLLYTQVLDDKKPLERSAGIMAGISWALLADATVVYTDLGISRGMKEGIHYAEAAGNPVEYRTLPGWTGAATVG
jgi:hypothetical protein